MGEPVLSARDVTVERGGVRILDGVELDVFVGDRLLVQGESGAGKTTLFEVFGLLEPPTDGVLRVEGVDATAASERTVAGLRASALGFVFQDFQLIPDLTAFENARVPQAHVADAEVAWLDELFETLGLEAARDQHPATLSGGEKQRVAIARALANRPRIVLADEPTGQLDPKTTERVLDLLDRVQAKAGSALVVVSHDPRVADRFDNVRRLDAGTLTARGPGPRVRAPRND